MKARLIWTIFLGLGVIVLLFSVIGSKEIFATLKNVNPLVILLLGITVFTITLLDSTRTYILSKSLGARLPFKVYLENTIMGFYFSAVTPFAAGGQPFQIYHLVKNSVELGKASMIVAAKFISSFTSAVLLGILAFIFLFEEIKGIRLIGPIILVGVFATLAFYFLFITFLLNRKWIESFFSLKIVTVPIAFVLRKDADVVRDSVKDKVENYMNAFETLWKSSKKVFFTIFILSFIMILLTQITGFLSLISVLEDTNLNFFKVIGLQSAMNMIVYFLPTPGASGGIEGSFYIIYSGIVGKSRAAVSLLIWRIATYYSTIVIGGILILKRVKNKRG
ncbi:MAG: hypothetical protein DRP23_04035 [Thermotogae bacterium]|nr:MAG: hypothetical protein DRP23_04035 [Thermotogota bacterium]